MNESLVMALIGKDRPGLVKSLAAVVEEHGGNWQESRMVQLAGEFAGLLRVEAPSNRVDGLLAALAELEDLTVTVERARSAPEDAATRLLKLELVGQDHPGIVILIRRRRRIAECAAVVKLLERAGATGIEGNINFA